MNWFDYLDILKSSWNESARKLDLSGVWYFQQDNDTFTPFILSKNGCFIMCQSNFNTPVIGPQPHKESRLHKKPYSDKYLLKQQQKLVFSMNNRLRAILETKGSSTGNTVNIYLN